MLDRGGRVLCRNLQATRLIQAMGLPEAGLTCCALLGCRQPDTVLAAACLTELAIGHESALPEVRVDISTAAGPTAMWVAAATTGRDGARVVLQLRPGIAQDRRRRTDPTGRPAPGCAYAPSGRTVVESAEGPIGGAWLDQRTGQLLKYLVAERHRAVAVDEIGESVWPGADYGVGASVRYYVHALRRKLEPQRGSREPSVFIAARSGTYGLRLDHVEVDADEFEAHLSTGLAAVEIDPQAAAAEIEQGLATGTSSPIFPTPSGRCPSAIACTISPAQGCAASPTFAWSGASSTAAPAAWSGSRPCSPTTRTCTGD